MAALKIRIYHGKRIAMGPGKAELLLAIQETGSISAAAKRMGMSYKRAWQLVNAINACFRQPVVETAMGGLHGGGARVSAFGLSLLQAYQTLIDKAETAAHAELQAILSQFSEE